MLRFGSGDQACRIAVHQRVGLGRLEQFGIHGSGLVGFPHIGPGIGHPPLLRRGQNHARGRLELCQQLACRWQLLAGNQGFDLPQPGVGVVRLFCQHLSVQGLRPGKVTALLGPSGNGHQVIAVGVLHQQGNCLGFLSGRTQAVGPGDQHVALQACIEFAHGISPLRLWQLFQSAQGTGIPVGTREVKRIRVQRLRIFALALHELFEAVVGCARLIDFALSIGQAIGQPGLVGGQTANLAQQCNHLWPVLVRAGGIGLTVEIVQLHALAQPGIFLLTGRGQAIEEGFGLVR